MFRSICIEAVALFLVLHAMNYNLANLGEYSSSTEAELLNSLRHSMHFTNPRVPLLYSQALRIGLYPQPYQSVS
jgi:hypothetical protein